MPDLLTTAFQTTTRSNLLRGLSSHVVVRRDLEVAPHSVYLAISPSEKVYVGITRLTLKARRRAHMSARSARRGCGNYFRHALRKYGDEMRWEILEDGIQGHDLAVEREAHWIDVFGSDDPSRGYNANKGGQGPSRATAELLQAANAHPVLRSDGRPFISSREAAKTMGLTEDIVAKAIRFDRVCCGFTFTKISYEAYLVAKKAWESEHGRNAPEPDYEKQRGWNLSDEHRAKLSGLRRHKAHSEQHLQNLRPKLQRPVRRSDGREFASITEAAEASGLTRDQVAYSIKRGCSYSGLSFTSIGMETLADQRVPKTVLRSDGIRFNSIAEAARSVSVTRPQMRYGIEHGRTLGGFTFVYDEEANAGGLRERGVIRAAAKVLKKAARVPVVRSDGLKFPTLTSAARTLGVSVSTVLLAVRDGRKLQDFTFTTAANCSE
jgi:hypothetical protein